MSDSRSASDRKIRQPGLLAFAACLGLFDGVDLTSMGVTMSRILRDLSLDPSQGGMCAASGMIGLSIGAIGAGRAADLLGRRLVLGIFTLALGIFSLLTSVAWNYESLLVARFFCGLGMGGVMPILMAFASDSAAPGARSTAVSALMASGSVGGIVVSVVSLLPDWRYVFYVGGFGPLLLLPVISFWLPRLPAAATVQRTLKDLSLAQSLFGGDRAAGTLLIWVIAFCTTLVSYIMINWLPSLLVGQGYSESQSHVAMIAYSIGGIPGNLIAGFATDRGGMRGTYTATYIGAGLAILGLALVSTSIGGVYGFAAATNFCILGAQLVTFALATVFYPPEVQATGLGATVSAGRLGSVLGPLLVGQLLHAGLAASRILLLLLPLLGLSLVLALILTRLRKRQIDTAATAAALSDATH